MFMYHGMYAKVRFFWLQSSPSQEHRRAIRCTCGGPHARPCRTPRPEPAGRPRTMRQSKPGTRRMGRAILINNAHNVPHEESITVCPPPPPPPPPLCKGPHKQSRTPRRHQPGHTKLDKQRMNSVTLATIWVSSTSMIPLMVVPTLSTV